MRQANSSSIAIESNAQNPKKIGATPLGMKLEGYHKECHVGKPAPTQSSSFKKIKFQMNDGKMSATAGLFATSVHRNKNSIEQVSHLEAEIYKLTWIVERQQQVC